MISLLLAASFFVTPSHWQGPKPVELTGDMRADWLRNAPTAEACVADVPPAPHILLSWHKLGVKVYRRLRFDPECAPEYVRRKAGFLAIREGVDGVWLEDVGKFPEPWKQAIREASTDVEIVGYARSLAAKALTMKAKNHKVWIEGRRLEWFVRFMDFESENIDTLRLEFVCYAKRLEQLLGVTPRKLAVELPKTQLPDRAPAFVPLAKEGPMRYKAAIEKTHVELSEGLTFDADFRGFNFTISSKKPYTGSHPGGQASLRLWIADGEGSYLPYEFKIDLSPIDMKRAPMDCWGLWFQEDRWEHGVNQLYAVPTSWRLRPVARASYSSRYPKLSPGFSFRPAKDGKGWSLQIGFSWFAVWGFWPSQRNGVMDRWYVSMGALPGVEPACCEIDWGRGREINFRKIAATVNCKSITERYGAEKGKAYTYHLWYDERLYGFLKTPTPTFQRCDTESDEVFWKRVVEPMIDENRNLEEITRVSKDADDHEIPAKLTKASESTKQAVYKALGKLFNLADRVSVARRDYILQRYAGGIPPEPPPKPPVEGAAAVKAPDVDNDDDAIQLDDKEF